MLAAPIFTCADATDLPKRVGTRRFGAPLLVLPRGRCAYARLPAAGASRSNAAALVRMQLPRLSPFEDPQAYFLKSGPWLHVWSWPKAWANAALAKAGLDDNALVVPSSLLGSPKRDGVTSNPHADGVETLAWANGDLVESGWQAAASGKPTGAAQGVRSTQFWPKPWQLHGMVQLGQVAQAAPSPHETAGQGWAMAGVLACAGAAGAVGWYHAKASAASAQEAALVSKLSSLQAKAPKAVNAQPDPSTLWLPSMQARLAMPNTGLVLEQLMGEFAGRGILIKDLTVEQKQLRLNLVSGLGMALSVDDAIVASEATRLGKVSLLEAPTGNSVRIAIALANEWIGSVEQGAARAQ
jgi:hypothetical protein